MKIKLSKNLHDVGMEIEAEPHELRGDMDAREFSKLLKLAFSAANAVWKKFDKFKTVTLDTLSQEEKAIVKQNKGKKGS